MGNTSISWTNKTWNPIAAFDKDTGKRGWFCVHASEGCRWCYAEARNRWIGNRHAYRAQEAKAVEIRLVRKQLLEPLSWQDASRVFVASMTDLFYEGHADALIDQVFAVMVLAEHHTFQCLTKRASRMRSYVSDSETPFRIQRAIDALLVDLAHDEMPEEWRSVAGYEGLYEVSSHGRVRRCGGSPKCRTERLVKPQPHRGGYVHVTLSKDGEVRPQSVQQMVLRAFVGPPNEGEESRHQNDDRTDNRLANLRWGTRTQNMADAARHGTAGSAMKQRADLSDEQVREIRERRSRGEKLDDIAAAVGSHCRQVSAVALGKIYKDAALPWPLRNVWLGVSAEDQKNANERIPLLLGTPAAVRWVSYEPALGPIDFDAGNCVESWVSPQCARCSDYRTRCDHIPRLDWIVVGGESGPGARRFDVEWARDTLRQCCSSGVAVFVKQLGAMPYENGAPMAALNDAKGEDPSEWPEDLRVREYPKVAA